MKALICHAPLDLRLGSFDAEPLGASQLRVRVAFGGICGSDLHYYQHGGFGTVRIREPMVLGHEVSGVIDEVGRDVKGFARGQRIAISPSRPCGVCRYCQRGHHNHCLDMRFYGSAMRFPHIHGAFREHLVIEAHQAHVVSDRVSLSVAALAEPLSVGLHAVARSGGVWGKQVLVTGCGPIGALLIGAIRRAGAARIVACDVQDAALAVAQRMGADETINMATQADRLVPYTADKGQFDVFFEASGAERALRAGIDALTPRGVLVAVGMGGDMSLPMTQIVAKEVDLRGTFRFHEEFAVAARFLDQGLIDGKPVITGVLGIDRAVEAFELAADKSRSSKVQLAFDPALA